MQLLSLSSDYFIFSFLDSGHKLQGTGHFSIALFFAICGKYCHCTFSIGAKLIIGYMYPLSVFYYTDNKIVEKAVSLRQLGTNTTVLKRSQLFLINLCLIIRGNTIMLQFYMHSVRSNQSNPSRLFQYFPNKTSSIFLLEL